MWNYDDLVFVALISLVMTLKFGGFLILLESIDISEIHQSIQEFNVYWPFCICNTKDPVVAIYYFLNQCPCCPFDSAVIGF